MPRVLIPIAVIILAVAAGLFALKSGLVTNQKQSGESISVKVGEVAPDLNLMQTDAQFNTRAVKLSSLKSKVVFVNFWATWCEACMVEIPSILALRERYKDKGLSVVLMNVDENPKAVLGATLKMLHVDFPIFTDQNQEWSHLFQVRGIPFTVVLDAQRKILFFETGERNWDSASVQKQFELWLQN